MKSHLASMKGDLPSRMGAALRHIGQHLHKQPVLTALKQLGKQIRFAIRKLKHLDLIVRKNAWIIVD